MMQAHSSTSSFKNIIKKVIVILAFIFASLYSINYFGNIYKNIASKNIINTFNRLRFEDFYKAENLDTVFIGSSHSYCTFDPEVFDEKLGVKSHQMGLPLQHPDASYYTLLDILEHQDIENVVFEVYWDMLDDDFDLKQADTLFEVMENKDLQEEYIKEVFPFNEKVKYKMDTARYMQDFLTYTNKQILTYLKEEHDIYKRVKHIEGEEYYRSQGYVYADYIVDMDKALNNNQFEKLDGKNYKISEQQKKYIKKIVDLCNEKDINLFLVTAPIANVSMDFIENYDLIHNKINDMAEEFNTPYLDLNLLNYEENILENKHFRDDAHLNHSGVLIISNLYADYLEDKIN